MSTLGLSWINRQPLARSRTKVLGVGFAMVRIRTRVVPHFVANCGRKSKKFNIRQLGRQEAYRRALKLRATYETAVGRVS